MTNITHLPNKGEIKKQAGVWLVRLDSGKLNPEESLELQEWLARSQFHRDYLLKLTENWDDMSIMSELAELFPLNEASTSSVETGKTGAWLHGLRFPVAAALAASFILVLLFFIYPSPQLLKDSLLKSPQQTTHYYTAIGQQSSYRLEDGSTISLNTSSRLKVDFSDGMRAVWLLQGEANFQVAKDVQRPFVVHVGNGLVRAVGTAFNIRLAGGATDVTVTEGRIKVYADVGEKGDLFLNGANKALDSKQVAELDAGKAVRYNKVIEVVAPVSPQEIERKLAWQQGSLIFEGETLQVALEEIERYTERQLMIIDPSIEKTRIGGHFKTNDIEALLAALDKGFGIKSEQVSPNVIHLSAK